MSVPVGRRKQSRFEAQHQFYKLRTEVTNLVENAYCSWMADYSRIMSKDQINHMKELYKELYGKEPRWKKGTR